MWAHTHKHPHISLCFFDCAQWFCIVISHSLMYNIWIWRAKGRGRATKKDKKRRSAIAIVVILYIDTHIHRFFTASAAQLQFTLGLCMCVGSYFFGISLLDVHIYWIWWFDERYSGWWMVAKNFFGIVSVEIFTFQSESFSCVGIKKFSDYLNPTSPLLKW